MNVGKAGGHLNMKAKKLLCLILTAMLLAPMLPGIALADDESSDEPVQREETVVEQTENNTLEDNTVNEEILEEEQTEEEIVGFDTTTTEFTEAVPAIKLLWDLGARSFPSNTVEASEDYMAIDVTPTSNNAQTAVARLWFEMNGVENARPYEIEIRLPMYIFKNRSGANIGAYKLDLQKNTQQGITGFYYEEDTKTNELVIKNFKVIEGGQTLFCQISYTFTPSDIRDGYSNTDITASYTIRDKQAASDPLAVTLHTGVEIKSLTKAATKYDAWQSSWGTNPGWPSGEYYYAVWTVTLNVGNSTQPFKADFVDTQTDGQLIGSSASSGGPFVNKSDTSLGETKPGTGNFYRYFLVVYPRSVTNQVTNNVTAALTGVDNDSGAPDREMDAVGKYTYSKLAFSLGGDNYSTSMSGNSSIVSGFMGLPEKLLQTGNDEITSVKLMAPDSLYTFHMTADVKGYNLTFRPGGQINNPDDYGQMDYHIELIDDMMYLNNERLGPEDYAITSCYLEFFKRDYVINTTGTQYVELTSSDFNNYGPVELFYKTGADNEWVSGGIIRRTGSSTYTHTNGGVTRNLNKDSQIQLPAGVTKIKAVHDSRTYRTLVDVYFTVELFATEHVRGSLQSQKDSDLYSVNSLVVRDHNGLIKSTEQAGNLIGSAAMKEAIIAQDKALYNTIVKHARATLSLKSINPITNLSLSTIGVVRDTGSSQTLDYNIDLYESASYGPSVMSLEEFMAMGYVKEQTEGTFYVLLHKGTVAENISVVTYKNKKKCDFTWHAVPDWQGSGRTMLIVNAKAPATETNYYLDKSNSRYTVVFSGFNLTYRLVNNYFNIVENGTKVSTAAAYRSATGQLSEGGPAPGNYADYQYFHKLESDERDDSNKNTVYRNLAKDFTMPTSGIIGVFKHVKSAGGYSFESRAEVFATGRYTYQLRYISPAAGKSTNLIMYDVLEGTSEWRGALESIDTSAAEAKGIDPIVHYSTKSGLDPFGIDAHANLSDTTIWSTTAPQSGLTAIAVDMRYKKDGSLYEIGASEYISCIVNMLAPGDYKNLIGKQAANRVSYRLDYALNTGAAPLKSKGLSGDAKVSLREPDIKIVKSSDPESGTGLDNPMAIGRGETLDYTISVNNNEGEKLTRVEVEDIMPDKLAINTSGIKYYFGPDPSKALPVNGSSQVGVRQSGKKLIFTVNEVPAGDKVSFVIPTTVNKDAADGDHIINDSRITKINGIGIIIESNKTYHDVAPVLSLHANKILTGRTLLEDEFKFELKNKKNGAVLYTAGNKAGGAITFHEIEYKHPGEYHYTVSEVKGNVKDVIYDENVFDIKVDVKRDADGRLTPTPAYPVDGIVFRNIYNDPASPALTIRAAKNLKGRTLDANEFIFTATDKATGDLVATAANNANGEIIFDGINLTSVGEYHYVISEVEGSLDRVRYDDSEFEVTVTVTRDANYKLVAEVDYHGKEIVFNNTYTAPAKAPENTNHRPTPAENPDRTESPEASTENPEVVENSGREDLELIEDPELIEELTEDSGRQIGNSAGRTPPIGSAVEGVEYIEFDADGTPLGEWQWDGDHWVFVEYTSIDLPETGYAKAVSITLFSLLVLFIGSLFIRSRKDSAQK